jgi:hypothetical protein
MTHELRILWSGVEYRYHLTAAREWPLCGKDFSSAGGLSDRIMSCGRRRDGHSPALTPFRQLYRFSFRVSKNWS